jgi:putative effector of murein hydrolase
MEFFSYYVNKLQFLEVEIANVIVVFGILLYQKLHFRSLKRKVLSIFNFNYFVGDYVKFLRVVFELKATCS